MGNPKALGRMRHSIAPGTFDCQQSDEGLLTLYRDTESIMVIALSALFARIEQLRDSMCIASAQLADVNRMYLPGYQIAHSYFAAG